MSRGKKEFVFTVPVEGFEEITVFAETAEEALEKLKEYDDWEHTHVSELSWTEEPTMDHLVAERGER